MNMEKWFSVLFMICQMNKMTTENPFHSEQQVVEAPDTESSHRTVNKLPIMRQLTIKAITQTLSIFCHRSLTR